MPTPLRATLLSCLVLTPAAFAQQRPLAWQWLRALTVNPDCPIPRADLVWALATDPATTRAMARPIDAVTAIDFADRLRDALAGIGYTSAHVTAKASDAGLQLQVDAGPRRRCGDIVVTGNREIATASIQSALQRAERSWRGWRAEEFAQADPALLPRAAEVVRAEYRAAGRHGTRTTIQFRDRDDLVDLLVAIDDEAPPVRAKSLALRGDDDANAAATLRHIGWQDDQLLTTAALDDLRRRLLATGRYAAIEPVLGKAPAAVLDPLVVRVEPIRGAPDVADARFPDLLRLQAFLDRQRQQLLAGGHLRAELQLSAAEPAGPFTLLPGALTMAMSTSALSIALDRLQLGDGEAAPARFHVDAGQLQLQHGERVAATSFQERLGVQFQITIQVTDAGETELRWGLGFSTSPTAELCRIEIDPRTANALLHRETANVRRDGDDLLVDFGPATVRIGDQGQVVAPIRFVAEGRAGTIVLDPAPLTKADRAGAHPVDSLFAWALDLGNAALAPAATADATVNALLRATVPAVTDLRRADQTTRLPIRLRSDVPPTPVEVFANLATAMAATATDSTWATTFLGAAATFLQGRRREALQVVQQLAEAPESGPLTLATLAWAFGLLADDEAQQQLRALAVERWSFDALYADLLPLLAAGSWPGDVARAVGARWRQTAELQPQLADLPGDDADLAAFRVGLHALWQRGGEATLRQWLQLPR